MIEHLLTGTALLNLPPVLDKKKEYVEQVFLYLDEPEELSVEEEHVDIQNSYEISLNILD